MQVLQDTQEIDERAAEPVNRPGGDHIELLGVDGLQHCIETRPLVSALRTADACVLVDLDDLPARALGDALQLAALVVSVLLRRRYPKIDGDSFHGAAPGESSTIR